MVKSIDFTLTLDLCFGQMLSHTVISSYIVSESFVTPWTVACHQPLLSMRFPRQDYWSGLPFPFSGFLPNSGIEPASPALSGRFYTTDLLGKPFHMLLNRLSCVSTEIYVNIGNYVYIGISFKILLDYSALIENLHHFRFCA